MSLHWTKVKLFLMKRISSLKKKRKKNSNKINPWVGKLNVLFQTPQQTRWEPKNLAVRAEIPSTRLTGSQQVIQREIVHQAHGQELSPENTHRRTTWTFTLPQPDKMRSRDSHACVHAHDDGGAFMVLWILNVLQHWNLFKTKGLKLRETELSSLLTDRRFQQLNTPPLQTAQLPLLYFNFITYRHFSLVGKMSYSLCWVKFKFMTFWNHFYLLFIFMFEFLHVFLKNIYTIVSEIQIQEHWGT